MSDVKEGAVAPNTVSSTENNGIPKERLDDLIRANRDLQEQNKMFSSMLQQSLNRKAAKPQAEHPALAKLKEENVEMYALFKTQEQRLARTEMENFKISDETDRIQFLASYGKLGQKNLNEVEEKLAELRAANQHGWTRDMIFKHLQGVKSIQGEFAKLSDEYTKSQPKEDKNTQVASDAPSDDPKSSVVSKTSSASLGTTTSTLEELEKRLGDTTF